MDFTTVIISAIVAGALVWQFLRGQHAADLAAATERARLAVDSYQKAEAELNLLREREKELERQAATATEKIAAEQQRVTEQEKRAKQYLEDIEKMRATLEEKFQSIAARLLEEKSQKFTEHNKTEIGTLLAPLKQQLTDFRTRIDTVYDTEGKERASLKTEIENLRQLNVRITDEAHALTQALKGQAQARGAWGELVLEHLLKSSGLRPGEDYFVQESVNVVDDEQNRRRRPDIIIRLPDQRHLVIDSKVSLVDYEQVVNATEPAAQDRARKAHVAAVRRHVEDLASKQYTDADKLVTPDYVLMFIPIDPAFTAALDTDRLLYEWAFERRVIIVTTPMLLATLKTIASIWKQERRVRNAEEIARRGGMLYDKFVGLFHDLEAIGQQLLKARETYDATMEKLKTGRGNLFFHVEELKKLEAKALKSLPSADTTEE